MRKGCVGLAGMAAALVLAAPAGAQQPVRIGVILAYSGQFADPGVSSAPSLTL